MADTYDAPAYDAPLGADACEAARELLSLRDFLRWAVSSFEAAGLVYGHGAVDALDEAAFIVLEGLHLPVDRLDRVPELGQSRRVRVPLLQEGTPARTPDHTVFTEGHVVAG